MTASREIRISEYARCETLLLFLLESLCKTADVYVINDDLMHIRTALKVNAGGCLTRCRIVNMRDFVRDGAKRGIFLNEISSQAR